MEVGAAALGRDDSANGPEEEDKIFLPVGLREELFQFHRDEVAAAGLQFLLGEGLLRKLDDVVGCWHGGRSLGEVPTMGRAPRWGS